MPSRTLSPRISTTVMTMSLLMTILSFFFLDRTSMAVYPSEVFDPGWGGTRPGTSIVGRRRGALSHVSHPNEGLSDDGRPRAGRRDTTCAPNGTHLSTLNGIRRPVKRLRPIFA